MHTAMGMGLRTLRPTIRTKVSIFNPTRAANTLGCATNSSYVMFCLNTTQRQAQFDFKREIDVIMHKP